MPIRTTAGEGYAEQFDPRALREMVEAAEAFDKGLIGIARNHVPKENRTERAAHFDDARVFRQFAIYGRAILRSIEISNR